MTIKEKDRFMAWLLKKNKLKSTLWLRFNDAFKKRVPLKDGFYYYELLADKINSRGWLVDGVNFYVGKDSSYKNSFQLVEVKSFKTEYIEISLHKGFDMIFENSKKFKTPCFIDDFHKHVFIDAMNFENLLIQYDLEK